MIKVPEHNETNDDFDLADLKIVHVEWTVLDAEDFLDETTSQWMSYDHEADARYLSIEKPQRATNSIMRDDGILLRYRGKKLVGVTVLEASKR